jgi:hypothetical protein
MDITNNPNIALQILQQGSTLGNTPVQQYGDPLDNSGHQQAMAAIQQVAAGKGARDREAINSIGDLVAQTILKHQQQRDQEAALAKISELQQGGPNYRSEPMPDGTQMFSNSPVNIPPGGADTPITQLDAAANPERDYAQSGEFLKAVGKLPEKLQAPIINGEQARLRKREELKTKADAKREEQAMQLDAIKKAAEAQGVPGEVVTAKTTQTQLLMYKKAADQKVEKEKNTEQGKAFWGEFNGAKSVDQKQEIIGRYQPFLSKETSLNAQKIITQDLAQSGVDIRQQTVQNQTANTQSQIQDRSLDNQRADAKLNMDAQVAAQRLQLDQERLNQSAAKGGLVPSGGLPPAPPSFLPKPGTSGIQKVPGNFPNLKSLPPLGGGRTFIKDKAAATKASTTKAKAAPSQIIQSADGTKMLVNKSTGAAIPIKDSAGQVVRGAVKTEKKSAAELLLGPKKTETVAPAKTIKTIGKYKIVE